MITEKQEAAICKLSIDDKVAIMTILIDDLGIMSMKEYCQVNCLNKSEKRNVYRLIKAGKLKTLPLMRSVLIVNNYQEKPKKV